jgi:hypothetical protein
MTISKNNFVVVYIIGATNSLEFAEYYAEKHNMDTINRNPSSGENSGSINSINWEVNGQLIGIESGDTTEILPSEDSFNTNILNPLKEALESPELRDRSIWGIVLGFRVPGGYYYINEYLGEHTISSTSRISRIHHDFELQLDNRLYNRQVFKRFDQDDADFALICSRIDAPTFLQAKEFIDNAEELRRQLFVGGTFYIDPYSDQIGSDADEYKTLLENFRDFSLPKLNLDSFGTQFIDPYIDVTIPFVQDDSFVWSWMSGQADDDFFQFTSYPRAFFYNADLNGGATIRNENSKTWPILSMRAGYVCCASSMSDPTISSFLNPIAFYNALFRQATIGEAYLFSSPSVDWTIALFGDPIVAVGFPQAVLEDTETLDDNQLWEVSSKNTSRIAAQLWQKEQDLDDIRIAIVDSQIIDVEINLLRPAHELYSMYSLQNRKSLLSIPVNSLFNYPIQIYNGIFGVSVKSLEDYLNLTEYKVSELLLEINEQDISIDNIYEEGWWELEHTIQDNYFGFVNYHFILEMYDNEDMTGPPIFSSDSSSLDGWSYELSLGNYAVLPIGGVPSSYIDRKVRYQSRKDDLISLNEYQMRGQTYYFRIRQYNAVLGTLFPWTNYSDIIWT